MAEAPINLHWWQGVPNFGDVLSSLVVAHVSGRPVKHTGPKRAELWAIGSLMHVLRRNREDLAVRPVVWGTGQLGHVMRDVVDHVDIRLLRGPLGAALLGVEARRFGDPGLLVKDVLGAGPERQEMIGLVPHHTQVDDPLIRAALKAEPRLKMIDPGQPCEEVCMEIASCAHVVSASLHGLIVADAYGVPSTWLHPGAQSHFKYYDYAASVGRTLPLPLRLEDLGAALPGLNDRLEYEDGIAACQSALYETFPAHLRSAEAPAVA